MLINKTTVLGCARWFWLEKDHVTEKKVFALIICPMH